MPTLPEISLPDFYTPEEKQYIQTGEWSAGTKSSLPLPSTSGESKLPISSTLDKPAVERQTSQLPTGKSGNENPLALVLSAISDIWTNSQGGKGTKLHDLATIQEAGRKQKTETDKTTLEKSKFIAAQQKQTLDSTKTITDMSLTALQGFTGASDEQIGKSKAAIISQAEQIGPNAAEIVRGILDATGDVKTQLLNSKNYLNYAPSDASLQADLQIVAGQIKSKRPDALQHANAYIQSKYSSHVLSDPQKGLVAIANELARKEGWKPGDKPIPLSVLQKYLRAEESPLMDAINGVGPFEKSKQAISDMLVNAGFESPGLATKTQEANALRLTKEPFAAEEDLLKLEKLRDQVAAGKTEGMTETVKTELKAMGIQGSPKPKEVEKAIKSVEDRLLNRSVQSAREQGLSAAQVPQRTPAEQLKNLEQIATAQSNINELAQLAPKIDLPQIVGGLKPWVNSILQTGRVGPVPVPQSLVGKLTTDQERFLALTMDYADSVLRLRSGAQINEQEFKRMLEFLAAPGLVAQTFTTRMKLQGDLLRVRKEVIRRGLEGAGFRAPDIEAPGLQKKNDPLGILD